LVLGMPLCNLILLTASRKCFGCSGPVSPHSSITSKAGITNHHQVFELKCIYNLYLKKTTYCLNCRITTTIHIQKLNHAGAERKPVTAKELSCC